MNTPELLRCGSPSGSFVVSAFAFHHDLLLIDFLREQFTLDETFFYNLMFIIRWLIQQCLSAKHKWLPVTPLVNHCNH
jgi:hypothetical protein